MLSKDEVVAQSQGAFNQWKDLWIKNTKLNDIWRAEHAKRLGSLSHSGLGRILICAAYGASLEDEIETLKRHQKKVDIICCDKALNVLMDHGVKPDYCLLADANIDYDTWGDKIIPYSEGISLICTITANPRWAQAWKGDVYFYINKDSIKSEEVFIPLTGCKDFLPASSNVGNALAVIANEIFKHDEIYLVGFDFGWQDDQNYYAFNDSDKRYYMKYNHVVDRTGKLGNTSGNLLFSARWLYDYYKAMMEGRKQVYNTSRKGFFDIPYRNLEKRLRDNTYRTLSELEKDLIANANITEILVENDDQLNKLTQEKHVVGVKCAYMEKEFYECLTRR